MLFEMAPTKSLEAIDQDLRAAAARHQFGVIAVHDLQQTMRNKGVDLDIGCMIYEVCQPLKAKAVLERNGAISTALPCRISVYGKAGGYRLATLLPTALMRMFNTPEVEQEAKEVEEVVTAMIREAV